MLLVQIDIDVHDPDCLPRHEGMVSSLRRLFFESAILTGQHIESWSSVRVICDVSQLLKVGKNYFQVGMLCCKPQLQEVRTPQPPSSICLIWPPGVVAYWI